MSKKYYVNTDGYTEYYESKSVLVEELDFSDLTPQEERDYLEQFEYMTLEEMKERREDYLAYIETWERERHKFIRPATMPVEDDPYVLGKVEFR